MKILNRIKAWLVKHGITQIGWGGAAVFFFIFWKPVLFGACTSIFLYVNFNILWKLTPWGKPKTATDKPL
jgi:hypothetical protein